MVSLVPDTLIMAADPAGAFTVMPADPDARAAVNWAAVMLKTFWLALEPVKVNELAVDVTVPFCAKPANWEETSCSWEPAARKSIGVGIAGAEGALVHAAWLRYPGPW